MKFAVHSTCADTYAFKARLGMEMGLVDQNQHNQTLKIITPTHHPTQTAPYQTPNHNKAAR